MLFHNTHASEACSARPAHGGAARQAHAAHALVLGFHSLCCGAPIALALAASGAVGLVGLAGLERFAEAAHAALHAYEGWILAASAALVALGAGLELWSRRGGRRNGFPVMFAVSAACLLANAALVMSHADPGHSAPEQASLAQLHDVHAHDEPHAH